jgi:cytoskeletal protein CcmA (bactofilin family)
VSSERPKGSRLFDGYYSGAASSGPNAGDDDSAYNELEVTTFGTRTQGLSGGSRVEDLSVETFKSSGSLKVKGHARASSFRSSGSVTVMGDLVAVNYKSSGYSHIHGQAIVGALSSSGSMTVDGGLRGRDSIDASGLLRAPWIRSRGRVDISGRVETGTLVCRELFVSGGGRAADVVAETIDIDTRSHHRFGGFLNIHLGGDKRPFKAQSLTAKGTVSIDLCDVDKVKGSVVRIGKDCHVGHVEYVTSCDVEKGAVIDNPPTRAASPPVASR